MVYFQAKPLYLRHFLMSLFFLWTLVFHGQVVAAYTIAGEGTRTEKTAVISQHTIDFTDGLVLLQGDQFLSEDATISTTSISLQQAVALIRTQSFRNPTDEAIPPYAARAPGFNFLNQFFLTSITPHAP